ncbi:MAG: polyisoprenoid-binding protein [Sphingobacteriales bacterium 41-5]|nr:MAG: polyisoprenoid-binding protein [Sphingobacteriales bacterium 41-5]
MMYRLFLVASILLLAVSGFAQKRYFTKTGVVSFEASTPLETIDPVNKSAMSVFDATSGQIEFAVLIKGFEFKKALMQEHFNENYMESGKYPKSTFKGTIENMQTVNLQKDGNYPVRAKGVLEIHGVKKQVSVPGTFTVAGQTVRSTAQFNVLLSDYGISIPGVVKDKISKNAKVTVNCSYTPIK